MNNYLSLKWCETSKHLAQSFVLDSTKSVINEYYSDVSRRYHNLSHLEQMFKCLDEFDVTEDVMWSVWFHDIVYSAGMQNNEHMSAVLAKHCLQCIGVERDIIRQVYQNIIDTKLHKSDNESAKLFLDADMSVLGSDAETYEIYSTNVRQEFIRVPIDKYAKGRLAFIDATLDSQIYMTSEFRLKYESNARINLKKEQSQWHLLLNK